MLPITALFALTFYLLPLAPLLERWGGGPVFALAAAGWLGLCVLVVLTLRHFHEELSLGNYAEWEREVCRRTGVAGLDWVCLAAAVGLTSYSLSRAPVYLPLALLGLVTFGLQVLRPVEARALGAARVPALPKDLPPEHLRPAAEPAPESAPDQAAERAEPEVARKHYRWRYQRHSGEALEQSARVCLLLSRYREFRERNPSRQRQPTAEDLVELVARGITAEVLEAAGEIRREAERRAWSHYDLLSSLLAFAQHFPYSFDKESAGVEEYWRYPIETLQDETGDCDCKSILAAALMRSLGYEVLMLLMDLGEGSGHMALAVSGTEGMPAACELLRHNGKRYFYCETTREGWRIGEVPPGLAQREDLEIHPL